MNFWNKLTKPIKILAPMADVTDFVFREIITSIGKPDVLFTEFTSVEALLSPNAKKVEKKLKYSKSQHPIVAQVWGSTPKNFAFVSKRIEKLGFDGIDINMGCPDKGIIKNNSGSALINQNDLVGKIVKAINNSTPKLPLSIKTRLANSEKSTKNWVSFLLSLNINALTIHARTAKDMSKGRANWKEIGKAVELKNKINPKIIIIGNGDVKTLKDVQTKHKQFGVDGVMIGRGIFENPWLFDKNQKTKKHTTNDYLKLLAKHAKLFHKSWGNTKNFAIMKKFFKVYIKEFRGSAEVRNQLMQTKSYSDFCLTWKQIIDKHEREI